MYNYIDFSQFSADEILVYLRKSRSDDPLLTVEEVLAKHESMLDDWALKNLGEKIPEKNKYREVVSGETIADRPGIQTLLKKIESPKIKAVLIVEVQRLSRGDLEDAGRIIKLFRFTDTLVITPQKTYDLKDEYDRDFFERELKRGNEFLEYTKKIMNNGRLLAVSQGHFLAKRAPFGYTKTWYMEGRRKVHTLAVNEEEAVIVRMIFDLYVNKRMGKINICHHLDSMGIKPRQGEHWSPPTIKDMLTNIHYIGKVRWNWRKKITIVEDSEIRHSRPRNTMDDMLIYEGKHEAIISEELFNAAQELHGKNVRVKAAAKITNPLAGLVFCQCGRAMTRRVYKNPDGTERNSPRLLCTNQAHCKTASCEADVMINAVISVLKENIADFEIRLKNTDDEAAKNHEKLIKSLEKKLQDIEAKELAQWEAQANPDASLRMPAEIFKKLNEKLLKDKEEIRHAIYNARESAPNRVDYAEKIQRFSDALNALSDPTKSAEEKNKLLRACIERINYNREKPQRIPSQRKRFYEDGIRKSTSSLTTGANWTDTPIQIDVKLRV